MSLVQHNTQRALWLVLLGLAALLPACAQKGQGRLARTDTITGGTLSPTTLPAIDVVNPNGTVHVHIDPTEPTARWECNITGDRTVAPETLRHLQATGMQGQVTVQNGRNVIRIRPTQELLDTPGIRVHLELRAPSNHGVSIRSTGGPIILNNVSGPMSITNGLNNGPGGNVIVRTDTPLTAPIWIDTPSGSIDLFMPPGSTGTFALQSDNGTADLYAVKGSLDRVRVSPQTWNGRLDQGQNEIVLRSGRGRVRAMVADRPTATWRSSLNPRDWSR